MNLRSNDHICLMVDFLDTERINPGIIECLGKKQALYLYQAITMDVMTNILQIPGTDVSFMFMPGSAKSGYEDFMGLYRKEEKNKKAIRRLNEIDIFPLKGENICEQVKNASEASFRKGAGKSLIIRPIVPLMEPLLLKASLELLNKFQVVLGPTFEGSFYLIGCDNFYPQVFDKSIAECGHIYRRLVEILAAEGIRWQEIELSYSIEGPDELNQLYSDIENLRLAGDEKSCLHTENCLMKLGENQL